MSGTYHVRNDAMRLALEKAGYVKGWVKSPHVRRSRTANKRKVVRKGEGEG